MAAEDPAAADAAAEDDSDTDDVDAASSTEPHEPSESDAGRAIRSAYHVSGRHLYDPCGEQGVLRGVNEMVIWSPGRDGTPECGEIAKTGANAVRIVWNETGTAAELKHRKNLLLNIANEAGDSTVTEYAFMETYAAAIERLRATGMEVPLVIDAPSWGQDIDMLQATGPVLTEHDPPRNLLFSVHMWWNDPAGERVRAGTAQSRAPST